MKIRRDKADVLWSKLVRQRDGRCMKCGRKPPWKLEAHHLMPRGRANTRYNLSNGITLCFLHHVVGDNSIHRRGKEMAIELIGKKEYKRLEKLSLRYISRNNAHVKFLERYERE